MLVAFVGLISGYDGGFEFKSGETYPETVPFTAMRIYLALFGAAMVPLAWYTAKELHFSPRARHLVTLMVLFGMRSLDLQLRLQLNPIFRQRLAHYQQIHPP